jgi:hypothetical protein
MADDQKIYKRKISDEEAQGRYILVLKNALDFFPKVGRPFKLTVRGNEEKTMDSMVTAVECWCMGPNKPHSHYRIDAKDFFDIFPVHFGKKVSIVQNSEKEYILS